MKKLTLREWASLSEVLATIGVVISLVFVGFSVNRNSDEVKAGQLNDIFDATREIELAVAADAEWSRIVLLGRTQDSLSAVEQYRYDAYAVLHLDVWDQLLTRDEDGLMDQAELEAWSRYFERWVRLHLVEASWRRIEWQFEGPLLERVEAALLPATNE